MLRATLLTALLAGSVLIASAVAPVSAQYRPQPGQLPSPGGAPPPPGAGGGQGQPSGGYSPDGGGYSPDGGGGYRRRSQGGGGGQGMHCATGKGVCELDYPMVLRAPCRCEFGFDRKRGVVVR
jgi:hypothetical protein